MPYAMLVKETDVLGTDKYVNAKGKTECVEFVRQVTSAPKSDLWRREISVKDAKLGEILRGTTIATFDDNGKYPTDGLGKHAAIFLSKSPAGIQVLDQWDSQHEVLPRTIKFSHPGKRSNNGDTFYVVE
jgi:hypothetical protein